MKIAAVYAKVKLLHRPDWLAEFCDKYNHHFDFHVTLKQVTYIEAAELPDMQQRLQNVLKNQAAPRLISN